MSDLVKALRVKDIKFQDKAVKSVASRVTNISQHLKTPMSVIEFKDFLNNYIISEQSDDKFYEFTDEEWIEIRKISDEKYATWDWNYGHSPKFSYSNEKKFPGGIVQANINVNKGLIKEIRFYGDFFSKCEVRELEELLTGVRYLQEDVNEVLDSIDIEKYMSNIKKENLLDIMFK